MPYSTCVLEDIVPSHDTYGHHSKPEHPFAPVGPLAQEGGGQPSSAPANRILTVGDDPWMDGDTGNNGGFQTVMRAPADFAFKLPDALDSVSAAPLLCAGVTVFAPLKKHITRPGMKVGVMGVGGLGHLALQFADALGAEVCCQIFVSLLPLRLLLQSHGGNSVH